MPQLPEGCGSVTRKHQYLTKYGALPQSQLLHHQLDLPPFFFIEALTPGLKDKTANRVSTSYQSSQIPPRVFFLFFSALSASNRMTTHFQQGKKVTGQSRQLRPDTAEGLGL